jgi:hypothetical protein
MLDKKNLSCTHRLTQINNARLVDLKIQLQIGYRIRDARSVVETGQSKSTFRFFNS